MALRYYIAPLIGTGASRDDARRPAYIADLGVQWGGLDFGLEPFMLVVADVTPAQHATISGNSDVISLPQNIDNQIAASLTAVQTALESINVPADWVTSGMTYRQIMRLVSAMFLFTQRLHGVASLRIFTGGVTLSTRFNQLPAGVRQNLLDAANSMSFDTSSLSGTSTIRQILKTMADQWGSQPINVGGFAL
jgi:hypothetical protein